MFADAKDIEADLIGEHDLLQQVLYTLNVADRARGGGVERSCDETIDAEFHDKGSSRMLPLLRVRAAGAASTCTTWWTPGRRVFRYGFLFFFAGLVPEGFLKKGSGECFC